MRDLRGIVKLLFGGNAEILGDRRFQLILLAEIIIVPGTTLISPILDSLTEVYDVSPGTVGLLVTAITVPPVVLIPVAGSLADWYGRRPVLISGLVLFGAAGSAVAFTTDFRLALALRSVQGAGYAFTLPILITTIRDLYSGPREATGQGLRNATGGVGNTVFPVLAGVLIVIAWQLPFLLYGLALFVAAALYAWFDEPTERDSESDRATGGHDGRANAESMGHSHYVSRILTVGLHPHVAAILTARMLYSFMLFAFLTYNSLVVTNVLHGTPALAALLVSIWAISYTAVSTQAGRITARWGYLVPLLVLNGGMGLGLILLATAPSIHVAVAGTLCIGVGVGLGGALYRSLVSGFAPPQLRGGLVSVGELLGRAGASVAPIALGLALSTLEPDLGLALALQWVVGGAGLIAGSTGVGCVVVYYVASPAGDQLRSSIATH